MVFYEIYKEIKSARFTIITGRNEVVAKVMFLQLCVILFTGGVSGRENPTPGRETPLARRPPGQGDPPEPPQAGRTPPGRETPTGQGDPPGRKTPRAGTLRHTVNERPVRILLECILVRVADSETR